MTVTVRGGVITGTVYNPDLTPAPGADITLMWYDHVLGTAVTDSEGKFMVEGIGPKDISIRALDPGTNLMGYYKGSMTAPNGYLHDVVIVLKAAGIITGNVLMPDAQTLAGEGVKVELYAKGHYDDQPLETVFTDADSKFEFPLVEIGDYEMVASDTSGNYGLTETSIRQTGEEVPATIAFLGKGSVTVHVVDGSSNPVSNAQLIFQASSMVSRYAGDDSRQVTADDTGTYTFDNVFIGSFAIQAKDPVTGYGTTEQGEITSHNQEVELTLTVAEYGSVEGTVYRADGTTVVPGARVSTPGGSWVTCDENGFYRFDILRLGTHPLEAMDDLTRAIGTATISLDTHGQTLTQDIIMLGQGTLVVTVQTADGNPVEGASVSVSDAFTYKRATSITGPDGIALVQHINEGEFVARVTAGNLSGKYTGTIQTGETLDITITLTITGTIQGIVYEPDGTTPASDAWVKLKGAGEYWTILTDQTGTFAFEGLPSETSYGSQIEYKLYAYTGGSVSAEGGYLGGQLRAKVEDLVIETQGQVITQDLVLIGLGSVTGRVLMPDSSSAPNMRVNLRSYTPIFDRT